MLPTKRSLLRRFGQLRMNDPELRVKAKRLQYDMWRWWMADKLVRGGYSQREGFKSLDMQRAYDILIGQRGLIA